MLRVLHNSMRMKGNFFWILFCAAVFFTALSPALAAQENGSGAESPASSAIQNELVIAHNLSHPPFKFVDEDGRSQGLIVDLWRLWSQKTGVPVRFAGAPFEETVAMVREGGAQVNAGLFSTEERRKFMDFSNPIHGVSYYIVYHKSILGIGGPEDLKGFKVGVPAGGYTEQFMRKYHPGLDLALYKDYPALFGAAQKGEIRVFIAPVENLRDYLKKHYLTNDYRFAANLPIFVRNYRGGIAKGNKELLETINQGLAQITPEERGELERKWLGWTRVRPKDDALVISVSTDYQPMSFRDPFGRPAGMLVDYWKLWAETVGQKVVFDLVDWDQSVRLVKDGEAAFHSGLYSSESRREWMDFSQTIYELESNLYYLPESPVSPPLESLRDVSIGVVKGSYQEEYALNSLKETCTAVPFSTAEDMLYALIQGRIDAFIDESIVVDLLLTRDRFAGKVVGHSTPLFSRSLKAGAAKGDKDLLELINRGVEAMPKDKLEVIEKRWIVDSEARYFDKIAQLEGKSSVYLSPLEKAWIDEHPVIRLGVDPGYEPFEFLTEGGKYAGVASEYVELLNKRLGTNLKVIPYDTWSEVIVQAKAKGVDVLPAVMKTESRDEYLVFTKPYLSSPEMIFCRTDAPFIGGAEDLTGKFIALKRNSYMEDRISEKYPELSLVLYDTTAQALEAVASGEADAYVNTLAHGSYVIAKYNISNIKVAAPMDGTVDGIRIAVRKDWPILRDILQKGLDSITPEEAAAIRSRWITVRFEHGREVRTILKWAGAVLGVILCVMLLVFIWNRRLAKEIARREEVEARLVTAKEKAESADRLKSAFLATMSHELRTPLNSIIGFSSIVLQELPGPLNKEQKKQMGMVRNSARHLLALINDVLDISKIEADQLVLAPEEFDFTEAVNGVVQSVRPLAEKKGLELELKQDASELRIFCDKRRMEQVLINLVNNAIKFTEKGSVSVLVSGPSNRNPQGVDMVMIQIQDTGIGIQPGDFSKLFKPFRQIETGLDRKYEGTGLGLSICKKLVGLMGGEITVESEIGHGSRFTVRLPVNGPVQQEA
ncbi:amino acid-binding domain sensor histidine kinase [Desulfatibacillum alkenivorans DSM 16219]|uniref:histidine kinase n=2 Tax=Desulfatibacillum alkenivorans TaxID=259354 RepID=A0A1M6J0P8_9BACT|nr:amino acid-binding domain sensor histidine kinase [Desulfatibacillum alkenivorans DSM 16219]